MSGPTTVGWCPGALRPMESGDGLILRVKPRGGRLTFDQAEAIAGFSIRFGNGHLDLTGRANLQIRGARPETLDALTEGLHEAGLLDTAEAVESLRNVVASPLAGIDPDCFDTRPFLAELERCLSEGAQEPTVPTLTSQHGTAAWGNQPGNGNLDGHAPLPEPGTCTASLRALPAKWSFVVDGGGCLPLSSIAADMRFCFDGSGALRVGLDTRWSAPLAAPLDLSRLLLGIAALVAAQPKPTRMKDLLARLGPDIVFERLGLRMGAQPFAAAALASLPDLFTTTADVVAFAPPFGGLPAAMLTQAVEACRAAGGIDLRLTPWRVLLATGISDRRALSGSLSRLDLILDAADPRLKVSACVGAPACHRGAAPARTDAAALAGRLDHDFDGMVHVAGCAKGCARPTTALWTLVAHEGRYDLFRSGNLDPSVTGLSSVEAANWLSRAGRARIS